ncbi:OmpA family protein [Acinetobacter silvestris]|uniref:OmpA-like domain-containing protein n=1 Tax=Acinetobacter silvestris TaxID=1977882 RepID=A0A1Y3CLJ3_9GAMM|nr:OmpA family protein [Acinetobacter silvestris]OTG65985.1 hypothetical protein B9T28_07245 [Acinetobacter silvestris]
MDLINILKEKVTPIVLKDTTSHITEKGNVLTTFYPFFLSLLKARPDLISTLQNSLNPRLVDIFHSNFAAKDHLLQAINLGLPQHELEATLNQSIAPTLGVLQDLAGSDKKQDILQLLEQNADSFTGLLPPWAKSIVGTVGLASVGTAASAIRQATPAATHKKSGFLLPIIALLILAAIAALLFKQCSHKPSTPTAGMMTESTSSSSTMAALQPAELHIATGVDGKVENCQALVGSQALLDQIKSQLSSIFGQAEICHASADQQFAGELTDQQAMEKVFAKIKGIPNVSLVWVGNQLTVQAPDLAQAQKLAEELKVLVPNMQVVASQSADASNSVAKGNAQAGQALASIQPDQANANDIVAALNLQVINFATGSSEIPAENKAILDKAASLLKQLPQAKLLVKGFTDNVGKPESNKALSHKRAQSVANYLTQQGVNVDQLTVIGLGQENPIADNSTKEGQFKNRRIEFEVVNTETTTTH